MQQAVSLVNLVGQYLPPLPKLDLDTLMQGNEETLKNLGQMSEDDWEVAIDKANQDVVEKALLWSQKSDAREMDVVMELFRDSPQDQLILTKIRFEQRIIQIKQVLQMQAKMIEDLNREIELVKIAKAIERSEIDNLRSSLLPVDPDSKMILDHSPMKSGLSQIGTPHISVSSKMHVMQSAKQKQKKSSGLLANRQGSAAHDGMRLPVSSRRDNIHQSYSQLSELDDNISAVILNYDNLHGLIESSGQPRLRMPQAVNGQQAGVRDTELVALNLQSEHG